MASEKMKIKQFRYYEDGNANNSKQPNNAPLVDDSGDYINYNFYCNEMSFAKFAPIYQLGIQTLPGTKFYLNQSIEPIIIGATGIYELDLRNTTANLSSLRFDKKSMLNIKNNPQGFLIIDMVYSGG